jgi:HSP20 family molecular chaperone IbpA
MKTTNLLPFEQLLQNWIGLEQFLTAPAYTRPNFPPYDIIRVDDTYKIVLALAGYKMEDIIIELDGTKLHVKSATVESKPETTRYTPEFIYQGIAKRSFHSSFNLSPDVIVDDADLRDGLLTIKLHRKPQFNEGVKRIAINHMT